MDEVERQRFLKTLRGDDDFRATVRRELLTEQLLNLPQTVATLVDVVAQQRTDFTALAAEVRNYMERTITLIGEGFAAARAETSELRADMETGFAAARAETSELRADMGAGFAAVDARFDQVNAEISELRSDMQAGFAAVDVRFGQVDEEISVIKDQLAS